MSVLIEALCGVGASERVGGEILLSPLSCCLRHRLVIMDGLDDFVTNIVIFSSGSSPVANVATQQRSVRRQSVEHGNEMYSPCGRDDILLPRQKKLMEDIPRTNTSAFPFPPIHWGSLLMPALDEMQSLPRDINHVVFDVNSKVNITLWFGIETQALAEYAIDIKQFLNFKYLSH